MPTYINIIILLITGSTVFCLSLAFFGGLLQRRTGALPPVPLFPGSNFPNYFAQFYTAFFIITFSLASIAGCMEEPAADVPPPELFNLIYNAVIQVALYVPFLVIYNALPSRELPRVPFLNTLLLIAGGLMLMYLPAQLLDSAGLTRFLAEETGCPEQQDVVETLMNGPFSVKVILLIMAVIIAPITEECCFRGFVYNILKQKSSPVAAALASAALFSSVHASLAQWTQLFIFGLVQCYMYEKTRTLRIPIVLHILFNAISSVVLLTM